MAAEHNLGPVAQIPKGEGRTFVILGHRVAVFHTRAGAVFATQAYCPHREGPLSDGLLGTDTLVCPLHDRVFDLRSGAGIGNDDCLQTFPVRVDDAATIVLSL